MTAMFRFVVATILSSVAFAQTAPEPEIALAAKSPMTLARYVESHKEIDWGALGKALGTDPKKITTCGYAENLCSTEIVNVLSPDQALVIIRGGFLSRNVVYLRYLEEPSGGWRFAGARNAYTKEFPSHHEVMRVGSKPFLKISRDDSQIGMGVTQEVEDWFDLTQPDFEPIFSFTLDGDEGRWSMGVGRSIHAQASVSEASGLERIDLVLSIHFSGPGLDVEDIYLGIYERPANAKAFSLRTAYSGLDRRTTISTGDFEELADPFSGLSNEKLLAYALPGLQKIAKGSDPDAREWLQSILNYAKDTPEKRELLDLLKKPSGPAQPAPPKPR
ncbi:MAG TPA: hypothetical protein VGG72_16915 [Bryobacteraceae bacterium]|jgi:hypothetical protein